MAIRELDPNVANQIAAGEVVERPASVVKELIENAIDANATVITITVENAGMKAIRVTDNGIGMSREDALLCFKRHATSKITNTHDLFKVKTLGFRGEAIPSIASVSEMTIETSNGEEGTLVSAISGEIEEHHQTHLRQGTSVLVENLFYNTPARLKYVKSLTTELSHITDIVTREAMGHPQIRFEYSHEGKQLLATNGKGRLSEVIAGVYGFKQARETIAIESESLDFSIEGVISKPSLTRASKKYLSIYLNGRYIKNYVLSQAITRGYSSKLMVGRYPIAVLHITLDPKLLDVNVHPTKQEVRISKEDELEKAIRTAIDETLSEIQRIPSVDQSEPETEESILSIRTEKPAQTTLDIERWHSPKVETSSKESHEMTVSHHNEEIEKQPTNYSETINDEKTAYASKDVVQEENDRSLFNPKQTERKASFPELDYVGQLMATYLVASDGENAYLIDQHAAQERIKYEYFREAIGSYGVDQQQLLVPIILEYPTSDVDAVKALIPQLHDMGIDLEVFGQNSFIVNQHPTWMSEEHLEQDIEDLIELALSDSEASVNEFREATAIMMSCRLSIKANHYLDAQSAKQLIHDLAFCENPYNCPHGRPVLIKFPKHDIERQFKRIQDTHVPQKHRHLH